MRIIFTIAAVALLANPVCAGETPTENRLGVSAERLAANEKPEPGTVLSRYRWCQKRFDHGYEWYKEQKKCLRLAPNKKRKDHGTKEIKSRPVQ